MPFANCTEAYKAHVADIKKGDPNYAKKLDRDNDGVGCEREDAPGWFTPAKEANAGTGVKKPADPGNELPLTGPGEVTAIGALVLLMGAAVLGSFKRRRVRFTA